MSIGPEVGEAAESKAATATGGPAVGTGNADAAASSPDSCAVRVVHKFT